MAPNFFKDEHISDLWLRERHWRALQIYNGYRICLATVLLLIYWFDVTSDATQKLPEVAQYLTLFYCIFSFSVFILGHWRELPLLGQAITNATIDILLLEVLMFCDPSMITPMGLLINVAIAGVSILTSGRMSLFFAALSTLLLLTQHTIGGFEHWLNFRESFTVSLLGGSFFATAMLGYTLSSRSQISQKLVVEKSLAIEKLERLNEHIIERLQSGIIVVDAEGEIYQINAAAKALFGLSRDQSVSHLKKLSSHLTDQFHAWFFHQYDKLSKISSDWLPKFIPLSQTRERILVILEDTTALSQQAQQMKLASLGQLTASIAHELRNPLGAISHASQLLLEDADLSTQSKRLISIVETQSERMNAVIKNILQLSRRRESTPSVTVLKSFLENFIEMYRKEQIEPVTIYLSVIPEQLAVVLDYSQITQVLTNLCDNGLRASRDHIGKPLLQIKAGLHPNTRKPIIDVIDEGRGVPSEILPKIFEPFFTSRRDGHGLGLYIANELCQANQAKLEYVKPYQGGACFRIIFSEALEVSHASKPQSVSC